MKIELTSKEAYKTLPILLNGVNRFNDDGLHDKANSLHEIYLKLQDHAREANIQEQIEQEQEDTDQSLALECEEKIRELFGTEPVRAVIHDECGTPERFIFAFTDMDFEKAYKLDRELGYWMIKDPEQRCRYASFNCMWNPSDDPATVRDKYPSW
jgi:hypothetical protein